MEQRVRIQDIAEELGVSTATVSNVIHGKTGRVSDETVRRVTALLEERQYIPSMAGVLLAQNSSRIIGFCSQDYTYLRSHMRIPFVVYDGYCEHPERILNITIDNFDGGYQVGRHFRELGHHRALCISDNAICMDMERYRGFCGGFAPGKAELLVIPMQKEQRWAFYRGHLEKFRKVSAVFAVSDHYAIDLMRFLTEQGFCVPGDVSIAGFDDTPICEMVHPALTTVRQDGALRAKLALEKLGELGRGLSIPGEVRLPVSLVVRGSTGIGNG